MTWTTIATWATSTVLATGLLVGCGGGEDRPAVCSDVEALGASIDELTNVDLRQDGPSTLKDAFDQVMSDLGEVKKSATDEYADEVEAVDQAATALSTDLSAAASSPSAATIQPLRADLESLKASLNALRESVQDTC